MQLFNTESQRKETIAPRDGRIGMYVCGVTPYDVTHLGHAFNYVFYDTLRKYLRYQGLSVDYVQNLTDVDDDIIRKAAELHEPVEEVVEVNVADFHHDLRALHIDPPTHYPRATEYISEIQRITQVFLEKGHAYVKGGDVFFQAGSFPEFGRLSRRSGDALKSETEPERLRSRMNAPNDFTLWQESLPGEPHWTSPWGEGRPGWHIECAAMSSELLGVPVDIHGGGSDLIFPHHESEIAQVESFSGQRPFVRYWVHVGMLRIAGEKMSKSLKNLVVVSDLLPRFEANVIRTYLLSHHYRSEPEYREQDLRACAATVELLRRAVMVGAGNGAALDYRPYERRFLEALDDDMDTPRALGALNDLAEAVLGHAQRGQDAGLASLALRSLANDILGLRFE
ncbi:MAG TPA: cysteine--tRNA ligase [Dehalococcoidia bacterium]|nr:cysteine--tRNA ligase [Dehalococcoidia bacterium]